MDSGYLRSKFDQGLDDAAYLASGAADQRASWGHSAQQVALTEAQRTLLGSFTRSMHVLALSGMWCGDCVRQGPMFQTIAQASNGQVKLRWFDRDAHPDLQEKVRINGGNRVPVLIFCAEDFEPVGWYGDKPLARYRIQAAQALGAYCPLPGAPVPADHLAAELADWVDQFERAHLILRLSARLRQKHGD